MSRLIGVASVGSAGCWLWFVTVIEAVAFPPLPPSVELTAVVVLFCNPAATAETFTVKLQVALAASVAPDKATLPEPPAAVIVPPPQLPESALGVAMTRPAGSVSVKLMPDKDALVLGLDRSKLNEVVPFNTTPEAPKDFEIVGG